MLKSHLHWRFPYKIQNMVFLCFLSLGNMDLSEVCGFSLRAHRVLCLLLLSASVFYFDIFPSPLAEINANIDKSMETLEKRRKTMRQPMETWEKCRNTIRQPIKPLETCRKTMRQRKKTFDKCRKTMRQPRKTLELCRRTQTSMVDTQVTNISKPAPQYKRL